MAKKNKRSTRDFDRDFDRGKVSVNFKNGIVTEGLGRLVKFPPFTLPAWLALEIENLAKFQANSKASVVRQLLIAAIGSKKKAA